jgi:tetratricopeptide (TPR) repeat protein
VNSAKQDRNLRILKKMTASSHSADPMAWFLQGGALLDLKRNEEALDCYIQCSMHCQRGDEIYHASTVRCASCLAELGKFEEMRLIEIEKPESEWHPELLLLRGQAEIALGKVSRGLDLLHRVFESKSIPLIPAYDPIKVRGQALLAIGKLWKDKILSEQ